MNIRCALALCLALYASSTAAAAKADAFLLLDGIPGSSMDKAYKDVLVVDDFSFGASAQVNIGSSATGAGAGKVQFDELTFSHVIDRASAQLLTAVSTSKVIKLAVLMVRKPNTSDAYLKVTLNNVLVSGVKITGSGQDPTRETVTLRFAKIQFEHFSQQPDGKLVSSGKPYGWDIIGNKPDSL